MVQPDGAATCAGSLDQGITVGDTVAVHAHVVAADQVSICGAQDYFIRAQQQ